MILQALNDYYHRKTELEDGQIPPFGFEYKVIPVIFEIKGSGELSQIIVNNDKNSPIPVLIPQSVKRASNISANLLWDNIEYGLGLAVKGKQERVLKQHDSFRKRIDGLGIEDTALSSLKIFLDTFDRERLTHSEHWEFLQTNPNISFRLLGDAHLICQRPKLIQAAMGSDSTESNRGFCLVSGAEDSIERLHPAIKGVWGAQSVGANIVSFNLSAFNSYGKEQGANSPIGERAGFAYTSALNHLLKKGSSQRIQVGDASTVFWAEKNGVALEESLGDIFGSNIQQNDDPDAQSEAVKAVYKSFKKGRYLGDDGDQRFFILGLSPNAARISVRFWQVGTVSEISTRIKNYYEQLSIIHSDNDPEFLPLFILLVNIATQGKSENIPPNLAGDFMHSILSGTSYPQTILSASVRRCKAQQSVNYPRAALIKAFINQSSKHEELSMALDTNNKTPSYRLGRLFAALEKIQLEANPGINATIRDRYYGAASSNPVSVFTTLIKLKNHHLKKLDNPGRRVGFEKLLTEIIGDLPPEFPTTLDLKDQGRFAVGYYHQKQHFYTKHQTEAGESQ